MTAMDPTHDDLLPPSPDSELAALRESHTLLRMQEAFDRDFGGGFTGLSVNETLFKLIRLGYQNKAKKMQSEFKVPEKVAWWIR